MAYIGKTPVLGNFVKLDAISVVNGQAAYTMQNGGVNFTSYNNVNQFLVSLNGILQSPTDSFTVSGSTLTFASNLSTGDVIDFVMVLGNTLDVGTPSDNTVSLAKLTATGTKDATTFLRGDNTFAEAGGGITQADMYRLTTNTSVTTNTLLSSWERPDTQSSSLDTFEKIGTGITNSSGTFSFPETGVYLIRITVEVQPQGGVAGTELKIFATKNNSSYTELTYAGNYQDNGYNALLNTSHFFKVENTTNDKIQFKVTIGNGGFVNGSTTVNESHADFIRLGDI